MTAKLLPLLLGASMIGGTIFAQSPYSSSSDFAKYASKLRENALMQIEPRVIIPTTSRSTTLGVAYRWKTNIVTTVFWCGEAASQNNPVHNRSSSWNMNWALDYGGYDDPVNRRPMPGGGTLPVKFTPRLNPFYVALPYNDVTRGRFKPEASRVIPWFKQAYTREGASVCKDRWIAVRNRFGKICYAQWSDCGPFRTDHWQYVFGTERPKPNLNQGAGLDVSPAVRDYLGLGPKDVTDWRFVEYREVPRGPWSALGENNHFVQQARRGNTRVAQNEDPLPERAPARNSAAPKVLTK